MNMQFSLEEIRNAITDTIDGMTDAELEGTTSAQLADWIIGKLLLTKFAANTSKESV